jgi:hypothetical protein
MGGGVVSVWRFGLAFMQGRVRWKGAARPRGILLIASHHHIELCSPCDTYMNIVNC